MFKSGVHLIIIKPGIVATPMTEGLSMPAMLVAEPDQIAADIVRAIEKKQIHSTPHGSGNILCLALSMCRRLCLKN